MAEQPPTPPPTPPRRPKRVSLKGRGADIFFGDYTPGLEADPKADSKLSEQLASKPSRQYDSKPSKQDDSLLSNYHDSDPPNRRDIVPSAEDGADHAAGQPSTDQGNASTPTSRMARSERHSGGRAPTGPAAVSSPDADVITRSELPPEAWERLDETATIANTFRYTEDELAVLNDAIYQIGKEHKVRITKQDAVRLGLYLVLEDYRRRGLVSLLGQLAENRQHARKTGGR